MASEDERSDISLCFQALGIEFGAAPEEVEKAYQRMVAEIKRRQASGDPSQKAEAAKDLELAFDLYEKIRNSVTYNSRMKEVNLADSIKSQIKKDSAQQFKVCPSCHKTIGATFKKCPFCRETIRTPVEMFFHQLFSGKMLAATILVLIAIIAAVVLAINPGLLKGKKSEPPVETQSFSVLSNQTTVTAPKP
jgi:hypothetical protein